MTEIFKGLGSLICSQKNFFVDKHFIVSTSGLKWMFILFQLINGSNNS